MLLVYRTIGACIFWAMAVLGGRQFGAGLGMWEAEPLPALLQGLALLALAAALAYSGRPKEKDDGSIRG